MKEWLNTKTYEYKQAVSTLGGDWVEIPDGAVEARINGSGSINFINKDDDYMNNATCGEWVDTHRGKHDIAGHTIAWKRPTHPEPLPFIDDEHKSLNDQYAEIEQVRQDMINSPSHYTQGKVECIDAIESATIGKKGIEAVCVANVIKYLWRYEEKNGLEDIKKAQWYLQKLIENTI